MRRGQAAMAAVVIALAGCSGGAPPGATATASATLTPTPTDTPTSTPAPTATPITYPMRLEQVGQFGGRLNAWALHGNSLYLGVASRLLVVDVSNFAKPVVTGRSAFHPSPISKITAYDHYALVTYDGNDVPDVFDTMPAGDPQLVSGDEAARVIDARNQATPEPTAADTTYTFLYDPEWFYSGPGGQPLTITDSNGDEVTAAFAGLPDGETVITDTIIARGHDIYAIDDHGIGIYDVSLPPRRTLLFKEPEKYLTFWNTVGSLDTDVGTLLDGSMPPHIPDLCVVGDELLTFWGTSRWSLQKPEQPEKIPTKTLYRCDFAPVAGGEIELTSSDKGEYAFLDTHDAANPVLQTIQTGAGKGEVRGAGNDLLFFYTTDEVSPGKLTSRLLIYDIANPRQPRLLSTYAPLGWSHYSQFTFVGKYIYINVDEGREPGQTVIDISDPAAPKKVDPPNMLFFQASVLSHGSLIYAEASDQLQIFNDNDLTTPITTFSLPAVYGSPTDQPCDCLWVVNDRLFIAGSNLPIVVDIHDPKHPQLVAKASQQLYQVAGYGDTLYFNMMDDGIGIFRLVPN